jgi:predicted nucleic acid-binding protein
VGLILDSSVLIAAERAHEPVSSLLERIAAVTRADRIMMSAISVVELEHGFWRARTPDQSKRRRIYLDEILTAISAQPFTKEIAQLAAKIDAEGRRVGKIIPFADLQIGVTALYFSSTIATLNVRHFGMIPGLIVQQL